MDRLLADFLALERHGVTLVLLTALSQQPNAHAGRQYYRPKNAANLLEQLGIKPIALLPVMAHQYSATFPDAATTEAARARLAGLRLGDRPVFGFDQAPENNLFFGCAIGKEVAAHETIELSHAGERTAPFYDLFYRVPHLKTGVHHPDSVLWFKTGTHRVHPERTPILNIFPSILDYYGVSANQADGLPRRGHSIADQIGLGRYRQQPIAAAAAE